MLSNGLALNFTTHYPGSISDLEIFQPNKAFHKSHLRKSSNEGTISDVGFLSGTFPNQWAVLVDKGYQGASELVCAIDPKKKPARAMLDAEDVRYNRKISSDRVIVANYFGRACGLWNVLSSKYRWAETSYDAIFKLCVALTNLHVYWNPLRQDDVERHARMCNCQLNIGNTRIEKRRRAQERHR